MISQLTDWVIKGNLRQVQILIEGNPLLINFPTPEPRDWTLLHYATCYGHESIVQYLLEKGANPNQMWHRTGETPLHLACSFNKTQVVHLLLQFGAAVNLKSHNGFLPRELARYRGHYLASTLVSRWLKDRNTSKNLSDNTNVSSNPTTTKPSRIPHPPLVGRPESRRKSI